MYELESNQPQETTSVNSDIAANLGFTPEQIAFIRERTAAQEAFSSQSNTNTAGAEVEAIMARVRRAHSKLEECKDEGPDVPGILARMRDGGFPKRAMDKLNEMFGPSLAKAEELLPLILAGDAILLLHGDRGPGKTQMATWWAFQRGLKGLATGRYVKAFDLLGMIKESWESKRASESMVIRGFKKTPFLVIDEFQERSESDWDNRTLTNILDHRYDSRLVTVLIANLRREDLKERIPASILSRAEEVGGRVFCNWPSYRAAD